MFVGGHEAGLRGGRARGDKALVAVGVEVRGAGSGRDQMAVIDDASAPTLGAFIRAHVEPGAIVHTDAWKGYGPLARVSATTIGRAVNGPPARGEDPDEILPRVHRAISNLKTWLQGTHRGVSGEHLQVYLDEFTFGFNRRRTRWPRSRRCSAWAAHSHRLRTARSSTEPAKIIRSRST